jgi:hypothetical protein
MQNSDFWGSTKGMDVFKMSSSLIQINLYFDPQWALIFLSFLKNQSLFAIADDWKKLKWELYAR